MKTLKYCLPLLLLLWGCASPEIHLKYRNNDEFKRKAYDECGRDYEILEIQGDTARIQCLSPF